jgi:hypothetical protein
MGSGYIQLLAVGSESYIFNYNPNISFFKIYYRRYANFYINNMSIQGNNIDIDIDNKINSEKKLLFRIPKDGDLLGKTYLQLKLNDYFFELFNYNYELISTLNTDILNFYDNYYIKVNNYSIEDIEEISIIKLNFYNTNNNNFPYFTILTTVIIDNTLDTIKNVPNIKLETDKSKIFYNLDFNTLFYSFDIDNNTNISNEKNILIQYFFNTINLEKLNYIQIDFKLKKISLKISYKGTKYYEEILNLIQSNSYYELINGVFIGYDFLYFSSIFSEEFYLDLIDLFYANTKILELETINNKIKSSKYLITEKVNTKINDLILIKNENTSIYLNILNGDEFSQSQLTIMKDLIFFGNLTNEYFNNQLISDGNTILSIYNTNNNKLSLILFIRIFVSMVCYKNEISITNFLKIVNTKNITNLFNILLYVENIQYLNEKILNYLMDPDILILSTKIFYIILYTNNIFKYFDNTKYARCFTDNKISTYDTTINNFYNYNNILGTFNNNFNNTSNDYFLMISELLFIIKLKNYGIENANLTNNINLNYVYNNNLFNYIPDINYNNILYYSNDSPSDIKNEKNNLNTIDNIIFNTVILYVTQSITLIRNLYNKYSNRIYNSNGLYTNIFADNSNTLALFPLSSYLYIYTNNQIEKCSSDNITNNKLFYNKSFANYIINLKTNLYEYVYQFLFSSKINIDFDITFTSLLLEKSDIYIYIQEYYKKSNYFMQEIDMVVVNNFLDSLNEVDYSTIYNLFNSPLLNLNENMMYQLFTYIDSNLFNDSFSNFEFRKYSNCNTNTYLTNFKIELNYLKFIFTINSPIYRIYFLFAFLSNFTNDFFNINKNFYDIFPADIETLRNLSLNFLLSFLNFFNNFKFNITQFTGFSKFNMNSIYNDKYYIKNNFLCFDQINLFQNKDFINTLIIIGSGNYSIFYNNFYFINKKTDLIQINNSEDLNNIPNICNQYKYNYDDDIIILFLKVFNDNNQYFLNIDGVYNFLLNFFNKYNFDYDKIIKSFINIFINDIELEPSLTENIFNNKFYYNCLYTTFSLGYTFDNINLNNVNVINNLYSTTLLYNYTSTFNYEYCLKSYNSKKNENFLNYQANISNCLNYFLSKLFNIFTTKNFIDLDYFYNYIEYITNYFNENVSYLYIYLISEYNFNKSIDQINFYLNKFNSINNTNISLNFNSSTILYNETNFYKYNFLIIILYYYYFIYNCLLIDINFYNSIEKKVFNSFEDYIIYKYTTNIYYDCINQLINVFNNSSENLSMDYSTNYFYKELENESKKINFYSKSSNIVKYDYLEYTYVNNFLQLETYDKIQYSILNISSIVKINSVENLDSTSINITQHFYKFYYDLIYNLTYKINKIISCVENTFYNNYDISNSSTLEENFSSLKTYYYQNSLYILTNIHNNLYYSYNAKFIEIIKNTYSNRICSEILYILKNFYDNQENNYFYNIFYNSYSYNNNNKLIDELINFKNFNNNNNEVLNFKESLENFLNNDKDIRTFYPNYINAFILNSIIYEKEINRILYYLATTYLISNFYIKEDIVKLLYSKPLYEIVKVYISVQDIKTNIYRKNYLINTSLYSNQQVFQIFNYENMINNITYSQNIWINDIISKIEIEPSLLNSYYYYYNEFKKYNDFYNLEIYDLKLSDGTPVIEYFLSLNNYEEFTIMIFDLINLNDVFSPNYIYVNIVKMYEINKISSKLDVDLNLIKKKIIVFLYFNYVVFRFLPMLLIENFEVNPDIILEYNILDKQYDIKISDIINNEINKNIINWIIQQVYSLEPTVINKNLEIENPSDFLINNTILTITKYLKIECSPIFKFNILTKKLVSDYNSIIGNNNIYTTDLIINRELRFSFSNLIKNFNTVINNDEDLKNSKAFQLTFYAIKKIGLKLNCIIYDLNNIKYNRSYNTSSFSINANNTYTKSQVNDFNLIYNLACLLLNNYDITYSDLYKNFNLVLDNLRKGTSNINVLLELFKGYASNYSISFNLTGNIDPNKYKYLFSKIYNINYLNNLSSELENLSIITPNDYDNITYYTIYGYGYKNLFAKFYSYEFNYNNFKNNYVVIYEKLYNYYIDIVNNTTAILNLKNTNTDLYVWLFINLIQSFISKKYYTDETKLPESYLSEINNLIKIYFKYNYSFRINTNISNTENLKLQSKFSKVDTLFFTSYDKILEYLIDYYYYQLFSTRIENNISFKSDVIEFFSELNKSLNVNFFYNQNYLNLLFKFEITIRFLIYQLNSIYKINIKINETDIEEFIKNLSTYICYLPNVSIFFNEKFISSKNNNQYYYNLFNAIQNLVNKNEFYKIFILGLSKIIYWINNKSYFENQLEIWDLTFKNKNFEYYSYANNQYTMEYLNISFETMIYLYYNFINYVILENNKSLNLITRNIELLFKSIFKYKYKEKIYYVEPIVLYKILKLDNFVLSEKNEENTENFLKQKKIFDKIDNIISIIFKFIINVNWGIIDFNLIDNKYNYELRNNIILYNFYYSYMNYLVNINSKVITSVYDYDYNFKVFNDLFILYYFIIVIITCQYVNFQTNYILLQNILTNANNYIQFGEKINTYRLFSNLALYMDNLNSNILFNNTIGNYYKNIQNDSILESKKYNIYNFKQNHNNYDTFTIKIYNNQISNLNLTTENDIGYNSFYNILVNILMNYTETVLYYGNDKKKIISNVYESILISITFITKFIETYYSGGNNLDMVLNNYNFKNIFDVNNFINEESQITIFTLIFKSIYSSDIYSSIIIIYFYYICFTTWTLEGINLTNNLLDLKTIFYDLINLINQQIIIYLDYNNIDNYLKKTIDDLTYQKSESFFKGLDSLLFINYNNYEFIQKTKEFFNTLILNNYNNVTNEVLNNLIQINTSLYSGNINSTSTNLVSNYEKNINNQLNNINLNIKNNKIASWKYLLGICFDFNNSKAIKNIKSIDNTYNNFLVQQDLINYIIEINKGIINEYGIIKLINKITLLFDDETISNYDNFNYKVFIDNFQNINKENLLNEMLGIGKLNKDNNIITGIKPYIKFFKNKTYYIPIKFFFENYSNSIPLITCMNTSVKIIIYINNIKIMKNSYFIKPLNNLTIDPTLNCDFIIVERDERKSLCASKIDNLIERNNFYEILKNFDNIINDTNYSDIIDVNFDFQLNNLVKELLWTFEINIGNYNLILVKNIELLNYISINRNISSTNLNFGSESNLFYGVDFIVNTKFYLDGGRRDGLVRLDTSKKFSYNQITRIINPYKYNTRFKLNKNYNTYSFGLEPTSFQPTGAINMSNYNTLTIQIQIDKNKLIYYLKNLDILFNLSDLNLKMKLTTFEYNIVRYQSSLAGLLFIN